MEYLLYWIALGLLAAIIERVIGGPFSPSLWISFSVIGPIAFLVLLIVHRNVDV